MSLSTRAFASVSLAACLAGCDADLLSPNRAKSAASTARATDATLGTWAPSATQIDMSWPDNSPNESGWEVHRSTNGATGGFTLRATLPPNTTFHSDAGLTTRTEYCYKVRSFKKTGKSVSYATFSNVSCSTTLGAPAAPSGLSAVPGVDFWATYVNLSWTDRSDDEQGFRIERAAGPEGPWTIIATLGAASSNPRIYSNAVPREELFCYRAVAFNAFGEGASNVDCSAAPNRPTNIVATSANGQSIDIAWTDASNVEDGYEVQRRVLNGEWTVAANLPANAASLHDVSVTPETVYEYRVRAGRDAGFTDFSASVTIAAASRAPDAPLLEWASPYSSSSAAIGWRRESGLVAEYRVERSNDGKATWTTIATVPRDTGSIVDENLLTEREVCYRVFGLNAAGSSAASNIDCTIPLAAPSNVQITPDESGYQRISWRDNSAVEEGYVVYAYSCNDAWCFEVEFGFAANTTSVTLGSNEWGREYIFGYVYAIGDNGRSDYANEFWAEASAEGGGSMVRSSTRRVPPKPLRGVRPTRTVGKPFLLPRKVP